MYEILTVLSPSQRTRDVSWILMKVVGLLGLRWSDGNFLACMKRPFYQMWEKWVLESWIHNFIKICNWNNQTYIKWESGMESHMLGWDQDLDTWSKVWRDHVPLQFMLLSEFRPTSIPLFKLMNSSSNLSNYAFLTRMFPPLIHNITLKIKILIVMRNQEFLFFVGPKGELKNGIWQ